MNGTEIYKIYSGNANEAEKNCAKKSLKLFKKSISTSKKPAKEKTMTGYINLSAASTTLTAGRNAANTKSADNTNSKHNNTAEKSNKHRNENQRVVCNGSYNIPKHANNKVINGSHSTKYTSYTQEKPPFTLN